MLYISPSLVAALTSQGNLSRLGYAHIGYRTITDAATVTASSSAPGFPVSAIKNQLTYERWSPASAPATLTIDTGTPVLADYLGVAAHDMGSRNSTVKIEYSENGTDWTEILDVQPANDNAIMAIFEPVMAQHWRITVDKIVEIGVVYIERALVVPSCMYGGHTPGTLSRQTEIEPQKSVTGQFLGRSIVRQGRTTSYAWKHLGAEWYRAEFDPFVEAATTRPFFIAWYPKRFPNEVLYAWTTDDIRPSNMGIRDLMEVGFKVEAVV